MILQRNELFILVTANNSNVHALYKMLRLLAYLLDVLISLEDSYYGKQNVQYKPFRIHSLKVAKSAGGGKVCHQEHLIILKHFVSTLVGMQLVLQK
jgi:hypothetical protein